MKVRAEKLIYKNSVLSCKSIDIHYENRIVNGYLLVEPNNLSERVSGITGIIILACYKEKVFLLKVRRPGYIVQDNWHWELPRGFIEEGESIEEAAIRELKEEVRIDRISISKISDFGCISPEPGVIRGTNKIIRVDIKDFENRSTEYNEDEGILDIECIAIKQDWITTERRNKKLLDCGTIIGLLFYQNDQLNAE